MTETSGSCLCGKIRFKVTGTKQGFFLCHCSRCQKETGSAHASNMFFKGGSLDWLSGKDSVKTFRLEDTRFVKSFCLNCGSAVPTLSGDSILVPAGSLDMAVEGRPDAHIFWGSRSNWEDSLAHSPKFDAFPQKS